MNHLYTRLLAVLSGLALMVAMLPASAGGVTLTLDDGSGTTDAGDGGSTEITTTWTTSGFYVTNTEITLTLAPAGTGAITHCATADFHLDAGTTYPITAVTSSWTSSVAVYETLTNVEGSTAASVCLTYAPDTVAANYSIALLATSSTDSSGNATTDFGASLYYVAGGNLVTVTAVVPATLSFSIRNSADTANTNVCNLGTLSAASVSACTYRLRIATNAASGFTAYVQPDTEGLNYSGNATITDITNEGSFVAGTEAYGISALVGATSGGRSGTGEFDQAVTEAGSAEDASLTFDADATPLNFTSATTIISYTSGFAPDSAPSPTTTSAVTHSAAINAGTLAGVYQQILTYTVTGSF